MKEPTFEKQHKEEYFQIVSQNLVLLLENIKNQPLEDQDYEVLSRRATREVTSYIQQWIIKPLSEIVSATEAGGETKLTTKPSQKVTKSTMQKVALFSDPVQEIFAALKEVNLFEPNQYEQLLANHPNIITVLTGFLNKLESARK